MGRSVWMFLAAFRTASVWRCWRPIGSSIFEKASGTALRRKHVGIILLIGHRYFVNCRCAFGGRVVLKENRCLICRCFCTNSCWNFGRSNSICSVSVPYLFCLVQYPNQPPGIQLSHRGQWLAPAHWGATHKVSWLLFSVFIAYLSISVALLWAFYLLVFLLVTTKDCGVTIARFFWLRGNHGYFFLWCRIFVLAMDLNLLYVPWAFWVWFFCKFA